MYAIVEMQGQHGSGLAIGQQIGQHHAAEQKFLHESGHDGGGKDHQHQLIVVGGGGHGGQQVLRQKDADIEKADQYSIDLGGGGNNGKPHKKIGNGLRTPADAAADRLCAPTDRNEVEEKNGEHEDRGIQQAVGDLIDAILGDRIDMGDHLQHDHDHGDHHADCVQHQLKKQHRKANTVGHAAITLL